MNAIKNYAEAIKNEDYLAAEQFAQELREAKPGYGQVRQALATSSLPRFGAMSQVTVATQILNLYR